MTDWPWQAWTGIAALITMHILIGGLVWRLSSRITSSESMGISVVANTLEIKRVESEFNDHRVSIAEKYVSKDALQETKREILNAIRELSDRFNNAQFKPREHV